MSAGERELGSVATDGGLIGGPFGSNLVSKDYTDSGIPVIRGNNMLEPYIGGTFTFVSPDKFFRDLTRNNAQPNDLVFTQRGTLGQVSIIPANPFDQYVISQSQMRLRVNQNVADPRFVYYACRRSHFIKQVNNSAIATGVPHINLDILARQLTIPNIPLMEQRGIAEVLGALDDKIAANSAVISTTDTLAKWTWIRAVSDCAHTAPLSSLARFVNGRPFTKDASGSGRIVIRIAELNSGIGQSTVYNDIEADENNLARPGDLLFAWSGSLTVTRWFREEAIVNQHIFKVIPNEENPMWLVNQAVRAKLREFQAIAADKATTMGHIQRRHLDEPVPVPNEDQLKQMGTLMSGLWDRALAAEQEKLRLESTRDELLPLLMSGKLQVRDAEKVVEEVV